MLTLIDLPTDIHDNIAFFLPDKDLFKFLSVSPLIHVSAYLRRDRQRAYWKGSGVEHLAEKGDLEGLQYLHGIGVPHAHYAMTWAAEKGHLAVVKFLHGIGAPHTKYSMDWAAANGHLVVVQFLDSIATP